MIWAVILILLLIPSAAVAQAPPATALTLQAATERALASNPTIAAARLTRAINLAGLAVAGERLNPEASVEIEKETPKQSFGFAMPLELGGKRARRIAVSEATIRAGEAELASTIVRVRNDVRRAYFDTLVAEARLGVLGEMQELSRRMRDAAQARFETGDAARLEVLQAELAMASAENEAIAARGVLAAGRARLNTVIGQPVDTALNLSTPIDAGTPLAVSAAVELARTGSTELALLDRQIEEQQAKLALARALRVPDVIPTATLTRDAEPEFFYGWRAGVAVTVPLFTSHRAGVQVEQTTLDRLLAEREATLVRIRGEVTAAAMAAKAQRTAYTRYRDVILPQAQQVERLAQDAYELGQTGLAPLLQSLQASRDIRLRSLDAVSQLQTVIADLERAIGAPLP
jgi:cobalt-zinc-cadmium efflux system outer membrane protein